MAFLHHNFIYIYVVFVVYTCFLFLITKNFKYKSALRLLFSLSFLVWSVLYHGYFYQKFSQEALLRLSIWTKVVSGFHFLPLLLLSIYKVREQQQPLKTYLVLIPLLLLVYYGWLALCFGLYVGWV